MKVEWSCPARGLSRGEHHAGYGLEAFEIDDGRARSRVRVQNAWERKKQTARARRGSMGHPWLKHRCAREKPCWCRSRGLRAGRLVAWSCGFRTWHVFWSGHGPLGMRFVRWSRMMKQVLGQRSIYGGDLLCVLSGARTWSHSCMGELELSQM